MVSIPSGMVKSVTPAGAMVMRRPPFIRHLWSLLENGPWNALAEATFLNAAYPNSVTFSGIVMFFFLPALFAGHAFWGFTGVEISQMLADAGAFIFAVPLVLRALKEMETRPAAR